MSTTPEQKKSNARLGLILASVALVFFVGFLAKIDSAYRQISPHHFKPAA